MASNFKPTLSTGTKTDDDYETRPLDLGNPVARTTGGYKGCIDHCERRTTTKLETSALKTKQIGQATTEYVLDFISDRDQLGVLQNELRSVALKDHPRNAKIEDHRRDLRSAIAERLEDDQCMAGCLRKETRLPMACKDVVKYLHNPYIASLTKKALEDGRITTNVKACFVDGCCKEKLCEHFLAKGVTRPRLWCTGTTDWSSTGGLVCSDLPTGCCFREPTCCHEERLAETIVAAAEDEPNTKFDGPDHWTAAPRPMIPTCTYEGKTLNLSYRYTRIQEQTWECTVRIFVAPHQEISSATYCANDKTTAYNTALDRAWNELIDTTTDFTQCDWTSGFNCVKDELELTVSYAYEQTRTGWTTTLRVIVPTKLPIANRRDTYVVQFTANEQNKAEGRRMACKEALRFLNANMNVMIEVPECSEHQGLFWTSEEAIRADERTKTTRELMEFMDNEDDDDRQPTIIQRATGAVTTKIQHWGRWLREKTSAILFSFIPDDWKNKVEAAIDQFTSFLGNIIGFTSSITNGLLTMLGLLSAGLALYAIGLVPIRWMLKRLLNALKWMGVPIPPGVIFWNDNATLTLQTKMTDPYWEDLRLMLRVFLSEYDDDRLAEYKSVLGMHLMRVCTDADGANCIKQFTNDVMASPQHCGLWAHLLGGLDSITRHEYGFQDLQAECQKLFKEWQDAGEFQGPMTGPLSFLFGAIGAGMTGSWPTDLQSAIGFAKNTAVLSLFAGSVGTLCDALAQYLPGVIRYYYNKHFNKALFYEDQIRLLAEKCELTLQHKKNTQTTYTKVYREDVLRQLSDVRFYLGKLSSTDSKLTEQRRRLIYYHTQLSQISAQIEATNRGACMRPAPFVYWEVSQPGMGKTSSAKQKAQDILGEELVDSDFATVSGANKHWDMVSPNAKVIIINEALLIDDPEGATTATWLDLCGNGAFSPPYADIDRKGSPIAPKLVIATSNVSYPKPKVAASPMAIWRRRNVVAHLKRTDICTDKPDQPGVPDLSKLTKDQIKNYEHFTVTFEDPVSEYPAVEGRKRQGPCTGKAVPGALAIAQVNQICQEWIQTQTELYGPYGPNNSTYEEDRKRIEDSYKRLSSVHQGKSNVKSLIPCEPSKMETGKCYINGCKSTKAEGCHLRFECKFENRQTPRFLVYSQICKDHADSTMRYDHFDGTGTLVYLRSKDHPPIFNKDFDSSAISKEIDEGKVKVLPPSLPVPKDVEEPKPDDDDFKTPDQSDHEQDDDDDSDDATGLGLLRRIRRKAKGGDKLVVDGFMTLPKKGIFSWTGWSTVLSVVGAGMAALGGVFLLRKIFGKNAGEDSLSDADLALIDSHQGATYDPTTKNRTRLQRIAYRNGRPSTHQGKKDISSHDVKLSVNGGPPVKITPVFGRTFFTNEHFLLGSDGKIAGGDIRVFISGQAYTGKLYPEVNCFSGDNSDALFINLDHLNKLPSFPDYRKDFCSFNDLIQIPDVYITLLNHDGQETGVVNASFMAENTFKWNDQIVKRSNIYTYPLVTKAGDCGRLAKIVNPGPLGGRILGFHVGYGEVVKGQCQVITRENLDQVFKAIHSNVSKHQAGDPQLTLGQMTNDKTKPYDDDTELTHLGYIEGPNLSGLATYTGPTIHLNRKTRILPSNMPNLEFEPKKSPAAMEIKEYQTSTDDPTLIRKDPLVIALSDFAKAPMPIFDAAQLQQCKAEMIEDWRKNLNWNGPRRRYTFTEAVNGIPGVLKPLPHDTSAGFPLIFHQGSAGPGKSAHYDVYNLSDRPDQRPVARPKAHLEVELRRWEEYLEGDLDLEELVRTSCKMVAYLKDEPVKTAKVKVGATRLIFATPLAHTIKMRQEIGAFLAAVNHSWDTTSTAIGMNPISKDMDLIIKDIRRRTGSEEVFAGDVSRFDRNLPRQIMEGAEDVITALCKENIAGFDEDRFRNLCLPIHDAPIVAKGFELFFHNGHRSGNPLTAPLNSLTHELLFRYIAKNLLPSGVNYNDVISAKFVGDDNLVGVREEYRSLFNAVTYAHEAAKFGQTYTSADKESPLTTDFSSPTEVTFLGCNIVPAWEPNSVDLLYTGVLEKWRCEEMLCHNKRGRETEFETALTALKLGSFHDYIWWNNLRRQIVDSLKATGNISQAEQICRLNQETLKRQTLQESAHTNDWSCGPTQVRGINYFDNYDLSTFQSPTGGVTLPAQPAPADVRTDTAEKRGMMTITDQAVKACTKGYVDRKMPSKALFERPMNINTGLGTATLRAQFTWEPTDATNSLLFQSNAPFGLLSLNEEDDGLVSPQSMAARNFLFTQGRVRVQVVVTAPTTAIGIAYLAFAPLQFTNQEMIDIPATTLEQFPHVRVNPKGGTYELELDYAHWRTVLNSYAGFSNTGYTDTNENVGRVLFKVLAPLQGTTGTDATISLYTSFDQTDYTIPKPTSLISSTYSRRYDNPQIPSISRRIVVEDISEHQGSSASTVNHVSVTQVGDNNVAGETTAEQDAQAEATTEVTSELDTGGIPTFDKPECRGGGVPVWPQTPGLSKVRGMLPTISLQEGQGAIIKDRGQFGRYNDEVSVEALANKIEYKQAFSWSSASSSSDPLITGHLDTTLATSWILQYFFTQVMFYRFKSIKFRFLIPVNQFFNGVLRFAAAYGAPGAPTQKASTKAFNTLLNVGGEKGYFEIEVPYNAQQDWLMTQTYLQEDVVQDCGLGTFAVYVANPLQISGALDVTTIPVFMAVTFQGLETAVLNPRGDMFFVINGQGPTTSGSKGKKRYVLKKRAGDAIQHDLSVHQGDPTPTEGNDDDKVGTVIDSSSHGEVDSAVISAEAHPSGLTAGTKLEDRYGGDVNFPFLITSLLTLFKRFRPAIPTCILDISLDQGPLDDKLRMWIYRIDVPIVLRKCCRGFKGGVTFNVKKHPDAEIAAVYFIPDCAPGIEITDSSGTFAPKRLSGSGTTPSSETTQQSKFGWGAGLTAAGSFLQTNYDTGFIAEYECRNTNDALFAHGTFAPLSFTNDITYTCWGGANIAHEIPKDGAGFYNVPYQKIWKFAPTAGDITQRNIGTFMVLNRVADFNQPRRPQVSVALGDDFRAGIWSPNQNNSPDWVTEQADQFSVTAGDFLPVPYPTVLAPDIA